MDTAKTEFKTLYENYAKQGDMTLEDFVKAQGISMDDFEEQSSQYAEYKVKQNLIVQGIMDAENMTLEDEKSLSIQDELIKAYNVKDLAALVDKYGQAAVDESIGLLRVEDFILDNATVEEKVTAGDTEGVNGDDPSEDGSSAEGTVDEELEAAEATEPSSSLSVNEPFAPGNTSTCRDSGLPRSFTLLPSPSCCNGTIPPALANTGIRSIARHTSKRRPDFPSET